MTNSSALSTIDIYRRALAVVYFRPQSFDHEPLLGARERRSRTPEGLEVPKRKQNWWQHPLAGVTAGTVLAALTYMSPVLSHILPDKYSTAISDAKGPFSLLLLISGLAFSWFQTLHQRLDDHLQVMKEDFVKDVKLPLDTARELLEGELTDIYKLVQRKLDFRKFDTADEGMRYLTKKLRRATSVLDVNVRTGESPKYTAQTIADLKETLAHCLGNEIRWTQLIGHEYDKTYVEALCEALTIGKSKEFDCRRLNAHSPLLNFVIINYGTSKEVLFGWGRHTMANQEEVFLCNNEAVVDCFSEFFNSLKQFAQPYNLVTMNATPERLRGPKEFWFPHFENLVRNVVLYSEPVCFRLFVDDNRRFFIRCIDINDEEKSKDDLKKELIQKLPEIVGLVRNSKPENFDVSCAYIPGGEVFARDVLLHELQDYGEFYLQKGLVAETSKVCAQLVNEACWWPQPTHEGRCLWEDNVIVIGNLRSIPRMHSYYATYTNMKYRLERLGVVIEDPMGIDRVSLEARGCKIVEVEGKATIQEDWSTESIVLVTRSCGPEPNRIITSVLANQGRGVHAVVKEVLTKDSGWERVRKECNLPDSLPMEFQLLFHVQLDHESRYRGWHPLSYAPFDSKVSR